MKMLLLSSLAAGPGQSSFRSGVSARAVVPIARAVAATGKVDVRVLASCAEARMLRHNASELGIDAEAVVGLDLDELHAVGWDDFLVRSDRESLPGDVRAAIGDRIERTLKGWRPDAILCWEAPSEIFRSLYPEALVLDFRPGVFWSPPYPALVSVNSFELCRERRCSDVDGEPFGVDDEALTGFAKLRRLYQDHFSDLAVADAVSDRTGIRIDSSTCLVPLQAERNIARKDESQFEDHLRFLKAAFSDCSADAIVVPKRRLNDLAEAQVLDGRTQELLRACHSGFRFHPAFGTLDNIIQYLVPVSGPIVSGDDAIGLQAKFYGKQLIVPARANLSYVADGDRLYADAANHNLDSFMAAILGRTSVFHDKLTNDGSHILNIVQAFKERRDETGVERFPTMEVTGTTPREMASKSRLDQSNNAFRKAFVQGSSPRSAALQELSKRVLSDEIDTVSFDVFDTLVCRVVLKPVDVFSLLGNRLRAEYGSDYPEEFLNRFDQLRPGMELRLRRRLDRTDGPGAELSIKDVYREVLAAFSLPESHAEMLIALEQEVELGLLVPRPEIVDLFHRARRAGKRVVILSDFIHGTPFVERVLRKCGVFGWDRLFVSVDVRAKKHNGAMFDFAINSLGLEPGNTIHVGDNPRGDVAMALSRGMLTGHTPAAPKIALKLLEGRGVSSVAVNRSVLLGAVLSTFAAHYIRIGEIPTEASTRHDLISTPRELGFLAIGPLMYFFTRHLLAQARAQGCTQIVFFARDSRVPFEMARHLHRESEGIALSYWPVSRAGVSGLDIWRPLDLYKVRIDDFRRDQPLTSLLKRRFHLRPEEIDHSALSEWSDKTLGEAKVHDLPSMAIFDLAIRSAEKHWPAFLERVEERRRIFLQGVERWGADLSKKTMTVDIGYTGSIHRMVAGLFAVQPFPALFMTYADRTGSLALRHADSYYLAAQLSHERHPDPLIRFNLILETLLNEGVGSVVDYEEVEGEVRPVHDALVEDTHATVVRAIHDGALEFAEYWDRNCKSVVAGTEFDPPLLSYFFDLVASDPTTREVEMLGGLIFDNQFSGYAARPLVERDARGRRSGKGVWKAASRKDPDTQESPAPTDPKGAVRPKVQPPKRSALDPVIGFAILHLRGRDLHDRFRKNPAAMLESARRPLVRWLGRLIYR